MVIIDIFTLDLGLLFSPLDLNLKGDFTTRGLQENEIGKR